MENISQRIANELGVKPVQVISAITLLDEGSTVPFIARYRKEVTGALDDTQLRTLEERLRYLRELEERREVILKSVLDQEKLTPELEKTSRQLKQKRGLKIFTCPINRKDGPKLKLPEKPAYSRWQTLCLITLS